MNAGYGQQLAQAGVRSSGYGGSGYGGKRVWKKCWRYWFEKTKYLLWINFLK